MEYKTLGKHPALNDELVNASDRVAVLLGATILDTHIERLLSAFFVEDKVEVGQLMSSKTPGAPLSSFSARIKAAYCLGLISKVEQHDLSTIRVIRNAFAHRLFDCDFQNEEIRAACESLRIFGNVASPPVQFTTRIKFTFAVVTLESMLTHRLSMVTRRKPAFEFTKPVPA